jgi:hypothetical protein
MYREKIESAWPGLGRHLILDRQGKFSFTFPLREASQLTDLGPLTGIPLASLYLRGCIKLTDLRDVTALEEMRLTSLLLYNCGQVTDLSPLKGMRLKSIGLPPVKNLTRESMDVLRKMASLEYIRVSPDEDSRQALAKTFWERYDAGEFNK